MNFKIKTNHENPPRNFKIFEEYFGERLEQDKPVLSRQYIPVYWTNYYISKNYGKDDLSDLQEYLDSLDKSKQYFTIVQWDDGILNNIKNLDLMVFASGGVGDIPIPLTSSYNQRKYVPLNEMKYIYSFIGAIYERHIVRTKMAESLSNSLSYITDQRISYEPYLDIMSKSLFSLCPRGYGKTSFRIYESLMCGSVPVYIYDNAWVPFHNIENFKEYGILCHVDELNKLDHLLSNISTDEYIYKREIGKEIFDELYSNNGIYNMILKVLS